MLWIVERVTPLTGIVPAPTVTFWRRTPTRY